MGTKEMITLNQWGQIAAFTIAFMLLPLTVILPVALLALALHSYFG